MARHVLFDAWYIGVWVAPRLADREARAVRRALAGRAFRKRLLAEVRGAAAADPGLARVRFTLTR